MSEPNLSLTTHSTNQSTARMQRENATKRTHARRASQATHTVVTSHEYDDRVWGVSGRPFTAGLTHDATYVTSRHDRRTRHATYDANRCVLSLLQ